MNKIKLKHPRNKVHILRDGYNVIYFCRFDPYNSERRNAPYIEHHLNKETKPEHVCEICWKNYLEEHVEEK